MILAHFGSASASDVQFVLERGAQLGKLWFATGEIYLTKHI
jgi:hypothetical protein